MNSSHNTASVSESIALPEFDAAAMLSRMDGDRALLAELTGLLREEADTTLAELRVGLAAGDGPQVERSAHRLRGALGTFGADTAVRLTASLEHLARAGDVRDGVPMLDSLERCVAMLLGHLTHMTETGGAAPVHAML